jgi:hypothetical protein
MLPHSPEFAHRKSFLVAATAIAMAVGIVAPAHDSSTRLAAPFMAMIGLGGGYLAGWLPLQFQTLIWRNVAAGPLRVLCLFIFYLFLVAGVVNVLLSPNVADELGVRGMTMGLYVALCVPACIGAAAGAHRVYATLLPPNISLGRAREE